MTTPPTCVACLIFERAAKQKPARWQLSQEEFASIYMGAIDRGERNVSLVNLEKIARAFKIALSELFRGV